MPPRTPPPTAGYVARPKKKPKKVKPLTRPSIPDAQLGQEAARRPLSPKIIAAATGISVKEARKARRQGRKKLRRAKPYTGARASAWEEGEERLADFANTAKGRDSKSGEELLSERLEALAPTGIRIVRALTGDKPGTGLPSPEEFGSIALTLGTGGAGALARARAVPKIAQAVKAAEPAAKAAKTARKTQKVGRAKSAAKARVKGPEARARRLRKYERRGRTATNPVVLPVASSDPARALIEGTVTADPIKAAKTTARAIPASLAYLATLGYDIGAAAVKGEPGRIKGALEEGGKAFSALAPLVSGDPEKVKKATEEDIGYIFAPLLPKGLASRPARAAGRAVRKAVRKVPRTQLLTERGARKRIAASAARETQAERYHAGRAAADVEKPLRKVKKAFAVRGGVTAADAVPVLARYGIGRKNARAQLQKVKRSLVESDAPRPDTTTRTVIDYLERNPDVLTDKNLWKSVDAYRKRAREVETSPRAKYLAQGRILNVRKPEERVPRSAPTQARTRTEAWSEEKIRAKEIGRLRRSGKRAEAKVLERQNRELRQSLDPFTRPETTPSIRVKRRPWNREMVEDFTREVQEAARKEGFEEPSWVAERKMATEGEIAPSYPASGSKAVHVKTGRAEAEDLADRSLRALVSGSIHAPRMQRGVSRFTRDFLRENAEAVGPNGRRVITGEEWNALKVSGKVNPRRDVLLPSRQFKRAVESEDFDLAQFHTEVNARLKKELHELEDAPGSKYVVVKRDRVEEFLDQIDPEGSRFERGLSKLSTAGSRTILGLSPAWLLSQVVAEGLQTAAAIANPARAVKAQAALRKLRKQNPEGYESFAAHAGESVASFESPHTFRVDMEGGTQQAFYEAGRALRKTPVGRFVYNVGSVRLLGLFDRWKSGKYRSLVLAANVDKRLNRFSNGLQGAMRQQDVIAKKLRGKPLDQQLAWMAKNPPELRKHLDYLDDVMGNWQAFTRFERTFAPALIFYPFLRMSLRWTFWSYPKRHPVKAQILYLLAQQNGEELEKLLGSEPTFLEYAMPVIHDAEGKTAGVLPAGRRFATPGLNTLVESIGEDNVAGALRGLNPALSIPIFGLTGINPMSGEQDIPGEFGERGLHVLRQLLSLPAPARALGINEIGKEGSPISERFERYDPNRDLRSFALPLIPLSGERAKEVHDLSQTLEDSSVIDSEIGQFGKLVDRYGEKKATKLFQEDTAAGKVLSGMSPDDPEFEVIKDLFYGVKYGGGKKKVRKSSGSGGAFQSTFGGGSSGSSGGGSGGAFEQVFGN